MKAGPAFTLGILVGCVGTVGVQLALAVLAILSKDPPADDTDEVAAVAPAQAEPSTPNRETELARFQRAKERLKAFAPKKLAELPRALEVDPNTCMDNNINMTRMCHWYYETPTGREVVVVTSKGDDILNTIY